MYLGKGAASIILQALHGARERIVLSSPWIGKRYVELLVEKALSGVSVTVITMDLSDNDGRLLANAADTYGEEEVSKRSREVARLRAGLRRARTAVVRDLALALFASSIFILLTKIYNSYFFIGSILFIIIGIIMIFIRRRAVSDVRARLEEAEAELERAVANAEVLREKLRRNLRAIVVPLNRGFIHAKVYIVDNKAWASSANLTDSGLYNNVEFVIEVDPKVAEDALRRLLAELIGQSDEDAGIIN